MYNEWSLDVFYKGIDDPALQSDMQKLENMVAAYKEMIASLTTDDPGATLRRVIEVKEELAVLTRRLGGYFSLRRSANSMDSEVSAYQTRLQTLMAGTAREGVMFEKYVGKIENLDAIIDSDELLREYKFYFSQVLSSIEHSMSDEEEALFAQMNISGGQSWSNLVSHLTANVEVDYKGGKTTLSAIRGLAESDDPTERKEAYKRSV